MIADFMITYKWRSEALGDQEARALIEAAVAALVDALPYVQERHLEWGYDWDRARREHNEMIKKGQEGHEPT
jgi:hypothetical protein